MSLDRDILLDRLHQDLVGPDKEDEELKSLPSDLYLTGILWPRETRVDPEEDQRLGAEGGGDGASDSGGEEEEIAIFSTRRPSTAGISMAVRAPTGDPVIDLDLALAVYEPSEEEAPDVAGVASRVLTRWRRIPISLRILNVPCTFGVLRIVPAASPPEGITIERGNDNPLPPGLKLDVRCVAWDSARIVTVTILNDSQPDPADGRIGIERATFFQVAMRVSPSGESRIIARPSRRSGSDEDYLSGELLYRDAREFAAGHTCSVAWTASGDPAAAADVRISWLPRALVPGVKAEGHDVFKNLQTGESKPLEADWLASASAAELSSGLGRLVDAYEEWIRIQEARIEVVPERLRGQARKHLAVCAKVRGRISSAIAWIVSSPHSIESFRLANRAMALQHSWDVDKRASGPLRWRPFQLAFMLLAAPSSVLPDHAERLEMDLLWFPTGGGKTEAYLGLVAFVAFYRRLDPGGDRAGNGVASVMRYTLRLLTTQQFARASALVMACEAMRRGRVSCTTPPAQLGERPFSIGLWVGGDATPNSVAIARESLRGNLQLASPAQLADCPACRRQLYWSAAGNSVSVACQNEDCALNDNSRTLPIWTVDEDIYRERPTLLIGTIDKFAQIVRRKEVKQLFSIGTGNIPDLIIQDELHLISGPLGTIAGLYETALDRMFARSLDDGKVVGPKIIGSTATIRRAEEQVSCLFDRTTTQFPPPGIDRDDSGFAVSDPDAPGRLYAGVTTAGRSAKFSLQAVSASLLQGALGALPDNVRRDPYWTLVAYFNSIRELGGALVLMQDDVADAIALYSKRRGETAREVRMVEELTSRRTQEDIKEMLGQLAQRPGDGGELDVVLATNMVSVGVDIPRLGVMLVNGQPKGIAEYIQATSRVGRGRVPGLVVAVLNNAKARDRSHFETFPTWHETLYRDVEATSVTPFSARARDRGLHAVLVAMIRHLGTDMLGAPTLDRLPDAELQSILTAVSARADRIDGAGSTVKQELLEKLKAWRARDLKHYWQDRKSRKSLLQSAEKAATMQALGRSPGEAWPTLNSMRNVEPSVPFKLVSVLAVQTGTGEADDGQ